MHRPAYCALDYRCRAQKVQPRGPVTLLLPSPNFPLNIGHRHLPGCGAHGSAAKARRFSRRQDPGQAPSSSRLVVLVKLAIKQLAEPIGRGVALGSRSQRRSGGSQVDAVMSHAVGLC